MDRSESITLAKRLYAALGEGDRQTLDKLMHAEFTGRGTAGLPLDLGGSHDSAEQMRRGFWGVIAKNFEVRAHPADYRLLDDGRLLVTGSYRGSARKSGADLDAEFMHILTFADGEISSLIQLTDSHRWYEAMNGGTAELTTLDYRVTDGVAVVVLNRPDRRNAIDLALAEDFLTVARRLAADTTVRAVLIEGHGPDLTVGGDIAYFLESAPETLGPLLRRMTGPFHEAFRILSRLDAPIVTAAHGSVAGGGLGFVYAADIVLAAEGTKFVTAFAGIGLTGDGGGTWHLPRLVGARRAAQMYLENYQLGAAEALEWGLVNEVVPASDLHERAYAHASTLAAGPTRAFGGMRELLRNSWTNSLSEQLLAETEAVAGAGTSFDAHNAIAAFGDKRRPTFEGR